MPFKITITEIKVVRKMHNPQWKQVGQDAERRPAYVVAKLKRKFEV